jgi:hypothetical protein
MLRSLAAFALGAGGLAAATPRRAEAVTDAGGEEDPLQDLRRRQAVTDARQQIAEVLNRYARANDRVDEEMLLSCFWPDSTHQHGSFKGLSKDFAAFAIKVVGGLINCTHNITNVSIDVVDNHAVSECYFIARHRRKKKPGEGEEDFFLQGRYLDKFENRGGVWKIVHRRGVHDYARVFDPGSALLDSAPAEQLSQRKPNDPLYAMLAELHGQK